MYESLNAELQLTSTICNKLTIPLKFNNKLLRIEVSKSDQSDIWKKNYISVAKRKRVKCKRKWVLGKNGPKINAAIWF